MGPGGGGAAAPAPDAKPKFREHVHSHDGLALRREKGDAVVLDVKVVGNSLVSMHKILQQLQTRKDRFYDYETVLGDVRRLNNMGSFDHVTFKLDEQPGGVAVTYMVHERPMITQVIFHGNRAVNDRELKGRAGIEKSDPLNEFSIESARRRLIDYYHEEGFNQAAVSHTTGIKDDAGAVVFRINEGPKERIRGNPDPGQHDRQRSTTEENHQQPRPDGWRAELRQQHSRHAQRSIKMSMCWPPTITISDF